MIDAILVAVFGAMVSYVFAAFKDSLTMHIKQCDQRYNDLSKRIDEMLGLARGSDAAIDRERATATAMRIESEARLTRRIERLEEQINQIKQSRGAQ